VRRIVYYSWEMKSVLPREGRVVVQSRQNLSGQPYVVARSEGRHPFDKLRAGSGLPLHLRQRTDQPQMVWLRCGVEIKLNRYRREEQG